MIFIILIVLTIYVIRQTENCALNLENRQRPQASGGNQDRQRLVKVEVLQFKERGFTELYLFL